MMKNQSATLIRNIRTIERASKLNGSVSSSMGQTHTIVVTPTLDATSGKGNELTPPKLGQNKVQPEFGRQFPNAQLASVC